MIDQKSDIYSLGVLFWELTSRKSPLTVLMMIILREKYERRTNIKFIGLYQKCWEELDKRPKFSQVNIST
ncbi:unnamed protein product [Rhizophagus irregularis]|nr:unnamed protein product [Rhizophagus irregularis]